MEQIEIIAFYEFKEMSQIGDLSDLRTSLKSLLLDLDVRGTIILAGEGYNGMVCGGPAAIRRFVARAGEILQTQLTVKSSLHETPPFRRVDVKIKPEIVTLKRSVHMSLGKGTHVPPAEWNALINDPETLVLDTRNDYEYKTGTFSHALNPGVARFSELPSYIEQNLDPERHKRVAMFCTGGIRCEKFAPYMKQLGFTEVYQLDGGILNYLNEVPQEESLWQGECFVFDERVTVDASLRKGQQPDRSQRLQNRKNPDYKLPE